MNGCIRTSTSWSAGPHSAHKQSQERRSRPAGGRGHGLYQAGSYTLLPVRLLVKFSAQPLAPQVGAWHQSCPLHALHPACPPHHRAGVWRQLEAGAALHHPTGPPRGAAAGGAVQKVGGAAPSGIQCLGKHNGSTSHGRALPPYGQPALKAAVQLQPPHLPHPLPAATEAGGWRAVGKVGRAAPYQMACMAVSRPSPPAQSTRQGVGGESREGTGQSPPGLT